LVALLLQGGAYVKIGSMHAFSAMLFLGFTDISSVIKCWLRARKCTVYVLCIVLSSESCFFSTRQ